MRKLPAAILATIAIMYLVPFPIYGGLSLVTDIEPPSSESPACVKRTGPPVHVISAHCAVYYLTFLNFVSYEITLGGFFPLPGSML